MQCQHILAIESSCDDGAAAVLAKDGSVLSDVVYSQVDPHAPFGGVVPEIASRHHLELMARVVKEALSQSNISPKQLQAVAVTYGPGLIGSLLVGVQFAKGFAQSLSIPLWGVHHIRGHIYAGFSEAGFPQEPFIALIASGGHSSLYLAGTERIELLGETRDDAAGEAFDKIGKMLGMGYPAGRQIDERASRGDENRFSMPIAFRTDDSLEYSFSGLKTHARMLIQKLKVQGEDIDGPTGDDVCAGLRKAIVDALLGKALLACRRNQINHLVLGGGVAANSLLRSRARVMGAKENIHVFAPPLRLCTDNAVMIGRAALKMESQQAFEADGYDLHALASSPLSRF